ncbi:MAG: hypothetical protein NC318_12110 [Blautia sp.]|nr:hypothetical protein [Lachnoclostridium sp.]MCM1212336.1 hypothetical protein [Blautia sp.]
MCKKRVISFLMALLLTVAPVLNVEAVETDIAAADKEEKEENEENGEEEEVITVEDANEMLKSYEDEEVQWEEIFIDSVEDLKTLSRNCRLDTFSQNKKVYLEADLDLTGSDFVSIPTFGGYFDGQGHTISGLAIRDSVSYTGLFCYTQRKAVIANLSVKGVVRPVGQQMVVGGIVGDNFGIVMNCQFEGILEGNDYVGGIAGFNEVSGILMNCTNKGKVTGAHYTGGIVGDNMGNVAGCINEADVNISGEDREKTLEDLNIAQYSNLLDSGADTDKEESINSNTIDSGGIAGLSTGIIQRSVNTGTIGYEHVGYNMGGIVGRQSGYVYACENTGTVYGRKDVGGIAGQTEPYITIDLTKDIANQLSESIDKMHDLAEKMLDDAGAESDTISGRLSVIQGFADNAWDATAFLADRTVEWTDNMIGSANDALNRLDYIMDESAKQDGFIDKTEDAAGDVEIAAEELKKAVESLDIYQYMTAEEKERYDKAKETLENAAKEHSAYYTKAEEAYRNLYLDEIRSNAPYTGEAVNEDDLRPRIGEAVVNPWNKSGDYRNYLEVEAWVHYQADTAVESAFPAVEGEQAALDNQLLEAVDVKMQEADVIIKVENDAADYADAQYKSAHGTDYVDDISDAVKTMSDIALLHQSEMTEDAAEQLKKAVGHVQDASGNMKAAGGEAKDIFDTLNGMPDVNMPQLGSDYRAQTNNLTSNLQGLSENIGYLNDEMASTNDVLLGDLGALNDQFSTVMRLYTDAIDGVLDMDYSNIYEDASMEDAENSTDATIADCKNQGIVRGDLNVSGIAGTMAIEYDFDLESDVTGIEDAKLNSTFLTKCVLRHNINSGRITAQKSSVGGITGLQEMGTILRCENYGRVDSTTGSYVGGIAGESRSYIVQSYVKCAVSGDEYVAGIAGKGSSIDNCCAMVRIQGASAFAGAIAGETDHNGTIVNNFFVSDELAGIDRISYSGKAEPIGYEALLEIEGLPNKFRRMTITFYADEEEIGTTECAYGGTVLGGMYPEIPTKEGFYADWDRKELKNVSNDEDVTVEYVRYLTTIASEQVRENEQSIILADGTFLKEAVLDLQDMDIAEVGLEDIAEHWKVTLPEDGASTHQFRYQAPQGMTKGVNIYLRQENQWVKADTEFMGIYYLFPAEGTEVEIAVCIHEKGILDYLLYIVLAAAALIVILVFIIRKKKRRKQQRQEAQIEQEERIEQIEQTEQIEQEEESEKEGKKRKQKK